MAARRSHGQHGGRPLLRRIDYWYPTGSVVSGNNVGMTTVPPDFAIP